MPIRPLRLAALAALALAAAPARAAPPRVVEITARRFEFAPREVVLHRGETVKLVLTSADVVHGFYQKDLGLDAEIHPGQRTELVLTPDRAGRFTTICDHFCGAGHGDMKLTIVVE